MNIINCAVFCGNRLGGVLSGRGRHLHKAKQYYFRFRICWYRCLQKAKVYELTKFRRHISVNGWDITTSVFEEQTSAILEIYFRFRFRPSAHYSASGYRTLSKSKHPLLKYDVISISQDGGRDGWILLPVSYLLMSLLRRFCGSEFQTVGPEKRKLREP